MEPTCIRDLPAKSRMPQRLNATLAFYLQMCELVSILSADAAIPVGRLERWNASSLWFVADEVTRPIQNLRQHFSLSSAPADLVVWCEENSRPIVWLSKPFVASLANCTAKPEESD